jgi:hypothetical protein
MSVLDLLDEYVELELGDAGVDQAIRGMRAIYTAAQLVARSTTACSPSSKASRDQRVANGSLTAAGWRVGRSVATRFEVAFPG